MQIITSDTLVVGVYQSLFLFISRVFYFNIKKVSLIVILINYRCQDFKWRRHRTCLKKIQYLLFLSPGQYLHLVYMKTNIEEVNIEIIVTVK